VGVHSGARARLTFRPAAADTGIVFVRTDVNPFTARIPALASHVTTTQLGTTIANAAGTSVATVEHALAALMAMGVDNALVEIDGPEVPILDGSSDPFVEMISAAGLRAQGAPRRVIEMLAPVEVVRGAKRARLEPHDGPGLRMDVTIDFESRAIGRQHVAFDLSADVFADEVGAARTFGFLHQVEAMRAMGLGQGGSLDNAVVVDGDSIVNEDGLRFADEFVRHKALDAVGDLALAGAPIQGRYVAEQPGHEMNVELVRALLASPGAWRWTVTAVPQELMPAAGV
jgi:UDP-3-O-[3-hydroxymyristoyl] N-acetylglucosamine deacetylase